MKSNSTLRDSTDPKKTHESTVWVKNSQNAYFGASGELKSGFTP